MKVNGENERKRREREREREREKAVTHAITQSPGLMVGDAVGAGDALASEPL